MIRFFFINILFFQAFFLTAQEEGMNNEKLGTIITEISEIVEGENGRWQFVIDSTVFICLTDESHNRMRIISPITEIGNMTQEQMIECMEANFHSMLDSNYALSDGVLWSTFIHPLRELTVEQVLSAVSQVYSGVKTFGTHYSSGLLSFPKSDESPTSQPSDKNVKKI
jgi:hypothetical protein